MRHIHTSLSVSCTSSNVMPSSSVLAVSKCAISQAAWKAVAPDYETHERKGRKFAFITWSNPTSKGIASMIHNLTTYKASQNKDTVSAHNEALPWTPHAGQPRTATRLQQRLGGWSAAMPWVESCLYEGKLCRCQQRHRTPIAAPAQPLCRGLHERI